MSREALPKGATLLDGQFTITKQLSAGGFGITYRAHDNILHRDVVIKECYSDDYCVRNGRNVVARTEAFEKQWNSITMMFMREARSLARLRHPNIVGVHRAFEENQTAYMALDLIEGHDLFDILESTSNALPPDLVRDILMRLLDAIEKVHEIDLLHRDISPDNILLEHDGNPVLIDFGAARADASKRTRAVSSLLVVKEGYSPKEFYVAGSIQAPCSDLYALAATFYHMVSGEAPIDSQTRMAAVSTQKPDPCKPLSGRFDAYEPAFLEAIDRAMELLPDDRVQSADDWRNLINQSKKQQTDMIAEVESKERLGQVLTQLVEETNEVVQKTKIIEHSAEETEELVPQPKVSSVPDWVQEFNDETAAIDNPIDEIDDAPYNDDELDEPLPTPEKQVTSDWIGRAREKQTRILEGQMDNVPVVPSYVEGDDPGAPVAHFPDEIAPVEPEEVKSSGSVFLTMVKFLGSGIAIGLILIIVQLQFFT
ncbi:MAG: serine/threonine-protein kinase [Pseudomonadota bacterium]